jgi:ribonucleotide monophosphatase NagD (HAD superfamily)
MEPFGCRPAAVVMVGDDVEADVNGAIAAGLSGILIRTGKYRADDEMRLAPGGTVVDDLDAAVAQILSTI